MKAADSARFLPACLAAAILLFTRATPAAIVTIWEDQFASIQPGWQVPSGSSLVSLATPADVVGSEDGFEARFTNTTGTNAYVTFTIPAGLVLTGDRVEYAIRSNASSQLANDRINLVAPGGSSAFDSGWVSHGSSGGLTYRSEPGSIFTTNNTTLTQGLRATPNLYVGNNGYAGAGANATFYLDYIRIVGERNVEAATAWTRNSSGKWHDNPNWSGAVPNGDDYTAILGNSLASPATIVLDAPATVQTLRFDSNQGYAVSGTSSITLAAHQGNARIEVTQAALAGKHQFQAPVNLGTDADVQIATGADLEFNNSLLLNGHTLNLQSGVTRINNSASSGTGMVVNAAFLGGDGKIAGNLLNTSAGTIQVEIYDSTLQDASTLDITGIATLAGKLDILPAGNPVQNGARFTVLTASSLVNNGISLHGSDASRYILSTTATDLVVTTYGSGDFNSDGFVDATDYTVWRDHLGSTSFLKADGDGSGAVDLGDYQVWKSQFGTNPGSGAANAVAVPEPCLSIMFLSLAIACSCGREVRPNMSPACVATRVEQ